MPLCSMRPWSCTPRAPCTSFAAKRHPGPRCLWLSSPWECRHHEGRGYAYFQHSVVSTAPTTPHGAEQRLTKELWVNEGGQMKPLGPSTVVRPWDLGRHQWGGKTGVWAWRTHAQRLFFREHQKRLLDSTWRQKYDTPCLYRDDKVRVSWFWELKGS